MNHTKWKFKRAVHFLLLYRFRIMLFLMVLIFLNLILSLFYRPFTTVTIDTKKAGFYTVSFYDVNKEEMISYGREYTFNGKINLTSRRLKNGEFENQYLVIVQSKDYIGISSFTMIDNRKSKFNYDKPGDFEQEVSRLYDQEYTNQINLKMIKKQTDEHFKINSTGYQMVWGIAAPKGVKLPVDLSDAVFLIDSYMRYDNQNQKIGHSFTSGFRCVGYGYGKSKNTEEFLDKDLIQQFQIYEITLSSKTKTYMIYIPSKYHGSLLKKDDYYVEKLNVRTIEFGDICFD